ncbi:MAG: repeat protein [Patescibacteria group bacterium]|nr:repeat protein [Patescibacteria group bacterium]
MEISSLLSVKLSTTPKIASLGSPVNFVAESKEAGVFEWNFGDGGSTEISSAGRISHTYKKSGTYDVSLTVRGSNAGGQNTISRKVYVTEANSPFALIGLKIDADTIGTTPGACGDREAFVITRVKPVRFTAEESVNVDGNPSGLTYSWKYASKTSTQRDFTYKFDELGCFPITLSVRSQKTGKTNTMNAYVKVENVLPTFSSLSIAVDKPEADPVIVKVTANNAIDEDGVITSYLWYYYTDSDPEPQDFRVSRSPATAFVLPRINGKYYFAVTMEDSNGEKVNSDQQREERYALTLVSDNINTPLISLKADKTNVDAGDKVKFDVIVKNVLQNDISDKAEYKWDYNGDGFYEETGDKPTVTHVYDKPGNFNMKVKVTYKGISNTKYQVVNVKNDLRPSAEYIAIGRKFVFLNTTPGVYSTAKWNLGNGLATSENKDFFTYDFSSDDDLSSMALRLDVSDGKDNKYVEVPLRKDVVNEAKLKRNEDKVAYFSYPRASDDTIEVSNPGDNVFLYLGESKDSPVKYAIDTDIDLDSDLNGESADDADNKGTESYASGAPFAIKGLANGHKNRTVRITTYDAAGKKIATKDVKIVVSYLKDSSESGSGSEADVPEGISDNDKANIEKLKDVIRTKAPEQDRMKLMQQLSDLQENWFDQREKTRIILDMEASLSELKIDQGVKDEAFALLEGFLMADSQTKDDIALAVKVLKSLIPESNAHYAEIVGADGKPGLVDEILSHPTNTELNRELGKKILDYVKDDQNVENKDKLIIKSQLEVIIYGGQANVPTNQEETSNSDESPSGAVAFLLGLGKGIGILIALAFAVFAGLFAFFQISNRNPALGFQDFLIERLFGGGSPVKKDVSAAPVVPQPSEPKPDPLASMSPTISAAPAEAPAPVSQDPLANVAPAYVAPTESYVPSPDAEATLPAWLKGSSLDPSVNVAHPATEEPAVESPAPAPQDLLANVAPALDETVAASSESFETAASSAQDSLENIESTETIEPTPEPTPETESPTRDETPSFAPLGPDSSDDLPDWLKGMDAAEINREVSEELSETVAEDIPTQTGEPEVRETQISDDLPDWLKSSIVTPTSEVSAPDAVEASSEETVSVTKKPKRTPKASSEETKPADATVAPASDDLPEWLKP